MSALTAGDAVADFEPHRRVLQGLAYRMLGSWSEAEDMVQEAWLRWRDVDRAQVDAPRAYLSRTVTRLCLDYIKSAARAARNTSARGCPSRCPTPACTAGWARARWRTICRWR